MFFERFENDVTLEFFEEEFACDVHVESFPKCDQNKSWND